MGVSGHADNSDVAAGPPPRHDIRGATPGVDLYVGGTEHAVLHLLYARFWHKVLFDLGHVSTLEPFFKLVNQGLILGEDGQKMSKSRGNVVIPDDILAEFGADAFRLYEMFMGPIEMVKPWNTKGVEGVYRFLGRVWRLLVDEKSETKFEQALTIADDAEATVLQDIQLSPRVQEVAPTPAQLKTLHACIKKVTEDLEGLRFNTAISALMIFVNESMTWETKPRSILRDFLILLQPFAPHLAEELFAKLETNRNPGHQSLAYLPWPSCTTSSLLVEDTWRFPCKSTASCETASQFPPMPRRSYWKPRRWPARRSGSSSRENDQKNHRRAEETGEHCGCLIVGLIWCCDKLNPTATTRSPVVLALLLVGWVVKFIERRLHR
jgi:leucyl-tRNA synthetase